MHRRAFLRSAAVLGGGVALGVPLSAWMQRAERGLAMTATGFGPLVDMGDLALPEGFSYTVIGREGEIMTDGLPTPGAFDGMGAFAGPNGTTILMRNHEIRPQNPEDQRITVARSLAYDPSKGGGCTKVVVDHELNAIETFTVLGGTSVNCAGGRMPWGSWLTCEETFRKGLQKHGYVFEVSVDARGPRRGRPIRQLGRFKHEAVVWCKGRLYLTEDIEDGSFYRYTPTKRPRAPGDLRRSKGKLRALALPGRPRADTRTGWPVGRPFRASWVTIDNPDPYSNNVRYQAQAKGAAIFSREEGAWASGGKVYFDCTDGGDAGLGQIWEYDPITSMLTLVYESRDSALLRQPDNLCGCPTTGCLYICEDTPGPHMRALTPDGRLFTFCEALSNPASEFAGATFDPTGTTLFVNQLRPGVTYAIRGPWTSVS